MPSYEDYILGKKRRISGRPPKTAQDSVAKARTYLINNPSSFQALINYNHSPSTMDPIGGGTGYSDIRTGVGAKFIVSTKHDLSKAFSKASLGDEIFVTPGITLDVTGTQYTVPEGVTLSSQRGAPGIQPALITSSSRYTDNTSDHIFTTEGEGSRFTGLRIRGPSPDVGEQNWGDDAELYGVSSLIDVNHGNLEVDNCELFNSAKWGIVVHDNHNHHIHHNFIHHHRRAGYGYGVWFYGTTDEVAPSSQDMSIIECNLMSECRHEIAASHHDSSSYHSRYNFIYEHFTGQQSLDRHGSVGSGAGHTTIHEYNVVANLASVIYGGHGAGEPANHITISNNYFEQPDIDSSILATTQGITNITISGNIFGSDYRSNKSTLSLTASSDEAVNSGTFKLTATASDPNFDILDYFWRFSNDTYRITESNTIVTGVNRPGVYTVMCYARNAVGILSEPSAVKFYVRDTDTIPDLKDRMIFWFPMTEASGTRTDSHNGYIIEDETNGPILSATGLNGDAMSLNGSQTLTGTDKAMLNAMQVMQDDFTFQVWIKPTHAVDTALKHLISFGGASTSSPGFTLYNRNESITSNLTAFLTRGRGETDQSFTVSNWHHVVFRADRDGAVETWIDGILKKNPDCPTNLTTIYNPFESLIISGSEGSFVQGTFLMQDMAMWGRKISDAEIATLYNGGSGFRYTDIV